MNATVHHQVVIVGGGTAGSSVAARLTKGWFNKLDVAVANVLTSRRNAGACGC